MIRDLTDFYNKEFKQEAQNKNFSKLASITGFKPTANKVMNTMLMKNIDSWTKVEVVSNITALETIYMGGSSNIDGVIVNNAISYAGSNNISLLETKGDFGARLNAEAAASRYIFTRKGPNFLKYFNKEDLNVLPRYNFEGQDIEYRFLTYNIPLLIANGSRGMGSGHAQRILARNPDDITVFLKSVLRSSKDDRPEFKSVPYFNGFRGTVEQGEEFNKWIIKGSIKRINKSKIEITEVPVGENYKSYIKKIDKLEEKGVIKSYEDLCDPKTDTFRFIVKCDNKLTDLSDDDIITKLGLVDKVAENYTAIDANNTVVMYKSISEIFWAYYDVKIDILGKRKLYLIDRLQEDIKTDISKYLFIKAFSEDDLLISKRKKADVVKDLAKFPKILKRDGNYDYLLSMSIGSLTEERMSSLMKSIKDKKIELDLVKAQTTKQMWLKDLA